MQYSNTTSKAGIVQMIEQTTGLGDAGITGNAVQFAYFNNLINQWYRIAAYFAWKVDKNWNFDDRNHTTFPDPTTTLVDGQRDYSLPSTALRIRQVEVKDNSGNYYSLEYMPENSVVLINEKEQEDAGVPSHYRLVGGSVLLYPKPLASSVTLSAGLRVTLDREIDPFTVSDTTQEPGIADAFQPILYYGPCLEWSTVKGVPGVQAISTRMLGNFPGLTEMMGDFYARRNQDVTPSISRSHNSIKMK